MTNVFSKSDWAYTKEANSIRFDDFECVSKQYSHPKTIFYRSLKEPPWLLLAADLAGN